MLYTQAVEFTRRFYEWELRGRGWATYPYPVALEPPFRPFLSHHTSLEAADDGRRQSRLSASLERLLGTGGAPRALPAALPEPEPEPPPEAAESELREFLVALPEGMRVARGALLGFLRALASVGRRIAFEVMGGEGRVEVRLALTPEDTPHALAQLKAALPQAIVTPGRESLKEKWERCASPASASLEFGLACEFMVPLASRTSEEPLLPIVAALASLGPAELGLYQVLFEETREPWAPSILRAVTTETGGPFFADAPEITTLAKEKVASPLFAAVLRVAGRGADADQAWDVVRRLAGGLAQFGTPRTNEFMPLPVHDPETLAADLLGRTTHRAGMLLSAEELLSLIQLPGAGVQVPELWRGGQRSKPAPAEVGGPGCLLGQNEHAGQSTEVRLPVEAKTKHVHVVGGSGTGKSTLLVRMILEDIEAGHGVGVLDPHGDLVDEVAARVPEARLDDVVLFDPSDEETVVGWNILGAHSESERELLASDLVGVFRRLSTSWGDQMTAVLGNAILVFLESDRGGTLLDLRRFLLDDAFRREMLGTVSDPYLLSFWRDEFPLLVGRRPQAPILTRLDTFLRSKLVRRVVTAGEPALDFRALTDGGMIFLGKLASGAIGEENAALLGSLLVSKFHQVTLTREAQAIEARRPFFLYIDEFHQVATPSMASLFSGARKYRLGLTVAHQDLYQLHHSIPEVERALLANAYTRISFRVGEEDARQLERSLSFFTAQDLMALDLGEAICRVGGRDRDFNLAVERLPALDTQEAERRREALREQSARRFARQAAEVVQEPRPPQPAGAPPIDVEQPAPTPPPPTRGDVPAGKPARREGKPRVDKRTLDYLSLAAASPFLTVRERNAALKLSAWRGQRVKSAIVKDGLAEEVVVNPGGRGKQFKLLELTAKGRALLQGYGVDAPSGHGRGGLAHQWWAHRIAAWLAERGLEPQIEDASSGARVDLAFTLGSERVAVEIEMTEAHAAVNLRKDLAAGYDRVVCLLDEFVHLGRLQSRLGLLPPGVVLGELQAFEALLGSLLASHLRGPNQNAEPKRRRRVAAQSTAATPTPSPPSQLASLAGDPAPSRRRLPPSTWALAPQHSRPCARAAAARPS